VNGGRRGASRACARALWGLSGWRGNERIGLSTGPKTTAGRAKIAEAQRRRVERLPRGEGEAVPVNRIEPWIVPHEPDLDLLADAQRFDALPLGH
jgi:hypothetical protein